LLENSGHHQIMRSIRVLPHRHQLTHGEIRLVQETMFISGSQTIHAVLESKILKVLPSLNFFWSVSRRSWFLKSFADDRGTGGRSSGQRAAAQRRPARLKEEQLLNRRGRRMRPKTTWFSASRLAS